MSFHQNDDYFWCSFEARQQKSISIEYVVLASQIVIFGLVIYAHFRAKKQNQLDQISVVYKLIITWLFCFFLKTILNTIAYFAYIDESPLNVGSSQVKSEDQIDFGALRIMSAIFLFLDVTTTFFIQMAMIYIPYLWMKNALQLLSEGNLQVSDRIKINRISWFLKLIKKYLLIRNIYMIYFIAVSVIVMISDSFKSFNQYMYIVSIIESIVLLVIYPVGLLTLNFIKEKIVLNQKQTKSMFAEFIILLLCNAVRIFLNSIFYFFQLVHYEPDKYCYDDHDAVQTTINCLYLIFGLSLMHILPGAIILYVYWPSSRDKLDLRHSLLVSQTRIG